MISEQKLQLPRVMIAATSSGSGKTLITCGILQALVNRSLRTASFKCGPDYIDPMFHSKIIGTKSRNLDTFFTDDNLTRYLFSKTAKSADISVIEGVMGFYDGISATGTKASSYDLAKVTDTPVILVIDCSGMSLSIVPVIQGFLQFRQDSHIKGVILNQLPEVLYEEIKRQIEEELKIKVLGYLPSVNDLVIESRHLGLVTPDEIHDLKMKLDQLAKRVEETIDLKELLKLAETAGPISCQVPVIPKVEGKPVIAVAKDPAFCFYYEDNLELLKEMGAELVEFSPLYDRQLPEHIHGLLLGGGYPELYAEILSKNTTMRESIVKALFNGLPCLAECGGFMYLHETMEDINGTPYPMAGFIEGHSYKTNRLNRFGYMTLTANRNQMIAGKEESLRGHEYHYYESTNCGDGFTGTKPVSQTQWNCIQGNDYMAAGFPHLYYYSNINVPYRFLKKCLERMRKRK